MGLLQQASLVVTPNAYKASKLYSVIPTNGTGDLDVVRATSATRVNSAGLIEIPVTNLVLQSDMFASTTWTKTNTSISANTIISPSGIQDADTIIANGVNSTHDVRQNVSLTSGITYTLSIFAKKGTNNFIQLIGGATVFGSDVWATFDLDNGIVGSTGSLTTASIQSVGNGWFRCSITGASTITASANAFVTCIVTSSTSSRFEINTLSTSVYLWGAQLEQGITSTEYIPTTTVVRTRFAGITQDGSSASNIPRLDYTNATCPSILVEPQRTNIALWSDMFANAYWAKNTSTILPNVETSPNGTMSADKMYPSLSGAVRGIFTFNNPLNTYNFSIYAKAGGKNFLYFYVIGSSANTGVWFNLSTGTIGTIGSAWSNVVIQNAGNGWYRCSANVTLSNASNNLYYFVSDTNNSVDVTANGTDGLFLWGAQLEAGSFATSYIPTTASTVTRNADVISKTGISSLINSPQGSFYVEASSFVNGGNFRLFTLSDGTANNRITIGWSSIASTLLAFMNLGGTIVVNQNITSFNQTSNNKVLIKWGGGNFNVFVNGVNRLSLNSITMPTANLFNRFGFDLGTNSSFFEGNVKGVLIFPTQLTDAQCISLTTL